MAIDPESCAPHNPSARFPYGFFQLHRGLEVFDGPAVRTDDVVMVVLSEVLGEFVVGEVAGGDNSMDHIEFHESGQIPIDRADGKFRVGVADLRDCERFDGISEHCDEPFSMAGQPLVGVREASEDAFS